MAPKHVVNNNGFYRKFNRNIKIRTELEISYKIMISRIILQASFVIIKVTQAGMYILWTKRNNHNFNTSTINRINRC
jgi:hypothetical protein